MIKKYKAYQYFKLNQDKDVNLKFLPINEFRIYSANRYYQHLHIMFADIKMIHSCDDKISTILNLSYPYLSLHFYSMKKVYCSKKTGTLIFRNKKSKEYLQFSFFRKRNGKEHSRIKHKLTQFALNQKFRSISNYILLYILIAQNSISGKSSILEGAKSGLISISNFDHRITLFIKYPNTASYSGDLNSTLKFDRSLRNSHVLLKSFTYPFILLSISILCKRKQSSTSNRIEWLISKSSTMKAALSLPQLSPSSTLSSSFLSPIDVPSMEYKRVSVHRTTNFILNYLRKHSEFSIPTDNNSLKSSLSQCGCDYFNLLKLLLLLIILLAEGSNAILLSGAPGSYAR